MSNQSFLELKEAFPKLIILKDILTELLEEGLLVAFSGGVDSGFLLWAASESLKSMQTSGKLQALFAVSQSVPDWDREDAKSFAASLNVELSVIDSHELQQEAYAKNDSNRCYYCKSELFHIAKQLSATLGYQHIAYGYNATDRGDIRPGHRSAKENNIHSPLEQAGFQKDEIRNILRHVGLNLADKPSSPCLASRIMTGVRVTQEKLQHIQLMENILRHAGLQIFRVRLHEEKMDNVQIEITKKYFRIEVAPEEMPVILKVREALIKQANQLGYFWVNLDLSGYRTGGGTLNQ